MDEPFASLDPDIRQDMRDLLNFGSIIVGRLKVKAMRVGRILQSKFSTNKVLSSNKTIVFVTHDIEDVCIWHLTIWKTANLPVMGTVIWL